MDKGTKWRQNRLDRIISGLLRRCFSTNYRRLALLMTCTSMVLLLYIIQNEFVDWKGVEIQDVDTKPRLLAASENFHAPAARPSESKDVRASDEGRESLSMEEVFEQRRVRYQEVCRALASTNISRKFGAHLLYYSPSNLSFCQVQKVGCTYWKRIFYFLNNETGGRDIHSPFEIERFYIHHLKPSSSKVKAMSYSPSTKSRLDETAKVMFTRDIYARLWSFYVDKFVLPDSWTDIGRAILRRRQGAEQRNKKCADDIRFEEFVDYAINVGKNVHWNPVHTVCNPCRFQPQYIGKVETFSRDTSHILRKVGLSHVIEGHGPSNHAEDEIRMLTDYIFKIYKSRLRALKPCLSSSGLGHRLWQAFVLNGYIAEDLEFPQKEFSTKLDNITDVIEAGHIAADLLLQACRQRPHLTSQQVKEHRRRVMVEHFRAAPAELLEKIVQVYKVDFDMFDYDPRPADIFGNIS